MTPKRRHNAEDAESFYTPALEPLFNQEPEKFDEPPKETWGLSDRPVGFKKPKKEGLYDKGAPKDID